MTPNQPGRLGEEGERVQGAPLLRVDGLRHSFRENRVLVSRKAAGATFAVDDVSFHIASGETLAIVGESGSGKSTVARCIAGIYQVTEGITQFQGETYDRQKLRRDKNLRRNIQMVFQDPSSSLNPRHRVGRILSEPLRGIGVFKDKSEIEERVESLLNSVGLPASAARRFPHEFSGGQRQRIAIARAVALHPALVVCDEPVSGLDVSVQGQVLNLMKQLQRDQHLAYLFISHDMAVVRHIADRIVVMHQGRFVEEGTVEDILSHPVDPYTRRLISAVPRGISASSPVVAGIVASASSNGETNGRVNSAIPDPGKQDGLHAP